MAHLTGGDLGQEVVGESHYIKTLTRCFKAGDIDSDGKRSYVVVKLIPENNNKHDKNAVAVVSDFGTVGYLSRTDAKLYRRLYDDGEIHTTDAVIVTRDGTLFGIWLDVLLDDDEELGALIQAQRKPKQTPFHQRVRPANRLGVISIILWLVGTGIVLGMILIWAF